MKRYTARTVQDAVNTGCKEIGVTIDQLNSKPKFAEVVIGDNEACNN